MMQREYFKLFKNQVDSIKKLPKEYQAEVFIALADYSLTGKFPEGISAVADAMLQSFSIAVEKGFELFQKGSESGAKGGRGNIKGSESGAKGIEWIEKGLQSETETEQETETLVDVVDARARSMDLHKGREVDPVLKKILEQPALSTCFTVYAPSMSFCEHVETVYKHLLRAYQKSKTKRGWRFAGRVIFEAQFLRRLSVAPHSISQAVNAFMQAYNNDRDVGNPEAYTWTIFLEQSEVGDG